jgi:hypothetical protein
VTHDTNAHLEARGEISNWPTILKTVRAVVGYDYSYFQRSSLDTGHYSSNTNTSE